MSNSIGNIKYYPPYNHQNYQQESHFKPQKHKQNIQQGNYQHYIQQCNEEMIIENENQENKKVQTQIQCQKHLNIQLLLKRQKNYNNTFKNCYYSLIEYLKNPSKEKGNFLWTLDCCVSISNLWKQDYPEYEPQFSKEFKKDKIIKEVKKEMDLCKENKEKYRLLNKFYRLLNNEKQDFESDETIFKNLPEIKATEENVLSASHNLMEINRRIAIEDEKEEFYNYPNYPVDKKIEHLRKKEK